MVQVQELQEKVKRERENVAQTSTCPAETIARDFTIELIKRYCHG